MYEVVYDNGGIGYSRHLFHTREEVIKWLSVNTWVLSGALKDLYYKEIVDPEELLAEFRAQNIVTLSGYSSKAEFLASNQETMGSNPTIRSKHRPAWRNSNVARCQRVVVGA